MSSTDGPPGGFREAKVLTRLAISWSVQDVSPLTPKPPIIFPLLYNGTPPPKNIIPPAIEILPPQSPWGVARNSGLKRGCRPPNSTTNGQAA